MFLPPTQYGQREANGNMIAVFPLGGVLIDRIGAVKYRSEMNELVPIQTKCITYNTIPSVRQLPDGSWDSVDKTDYDNFLLNTD